jgi:hypothetical protein
MPVGSIVLMNVNVEGLEPVTQSGFELCNVVVHTFRALLSKHSNLSWCLTAALLHVLMPAGYIIESGRFYSQVFSGRQSDPISQLFAYRSARRCSRLPFPFRRREA